MSASGSICLLLKENAEPNFERLGTALEKFGFRFLECASYAENLAPLPFPLESYSDFLKLDYQTMLTEHQYWVYKNDEGFYFNFQQICGRTLFFLELPGKGKYEIFEYLISCNNAPRHFVMELKLALDAELVWGSMIDNNSPETISGYIMDKLSIYSIDFDYVQLLFFQSMDVTKFSQGTNRMNTYNYADGALLCTGPFDENPTISKK